MAVAVLFPHFDHPAIEERYGSWQAQLLLREGAVAFHYYDREEPIAEPAAEISSEHVVVITDPLMLAPAGLGSRLASLLKTQSAFAALPVSNEAAREEQRVELPGYLTLREMQIASQSLRDAEPALRRVVWDRSDPGAFVCATDDLATANKPARLALEGREVVISARDFVHRWSSLRGQVREDLLSRISLDAKSVLEFGCGEAPLGAALKQRQRCRVVGIEIDRQAAAIARKRIDDVYCGDVREIVSILNERFDTIIGSEIVEHVDDPWSLLAELRRIATPGGRLLLSIPNVANAAIINDLLQGRFDYAYIGLTCVGHLRFFTRRAIEELLAIAGWSVVEIAPQNLVSLSGGELLAAIERADIPFSKDDLTAAGYYVVAENRR